MCNPALAVAVVGVIASAASGVASYVQQKNLQEAEIENANAAAASDYAQNKNQQEQIDAAGSLDMTERLRQSLKERAAIRVGAGEAGLTTGREELAASQSASKDVAIMDANKRAGLAQARVDAEANHANAQGRINAAKARTPSGIAAGLQIGSGALSTGLGLYGGAKAAID